MENNRKVTDWLIIVVFLATIGIPCGYVVSDVTSKAATDGKGTAGIAKAALAESRSFVKKNSFGADLAVAPCNWMFVKWLDYSPNPTLVLGDDNWMFYMKSNTGLAYYRRTKPFTDADLAHWETYLRTRRDWCAERGMQYVVVVAPNKSSVYQKHIPSRVTMLHDKNRLDQLLSYLPSDLANLIIDLRPALQDAAKAEIVYLKKDSHWNDLGAYFGYRAILSGLRKYKSGDWTQPVEILRSKDELSGEGDIAYLLKSKYLCNELRPRYEVLNSQSKELEFDQATLGALLPQSNWPNFTFPRTFEVDTTNDPTNRPTAVMFRDSFSDALVPYMSENFERITFVWNPNFYAEEKMLSRFDTKHVESEKPDFVIEEFVERYMALEPPQIDLD
jgi:alginate O-acetyltransferase complex protein AlgJ